MTHRREVTEPMADVDATAPPDGRATADVLDLLAEAVLLRLDKVLGERVESLGAHAANPPDEPRWLRVSDVALRVGACERTVYRALRSGALAGERLGAHWRIRPESVDAWLAAPRPAQTTAVGPPPRSTGKRPPTAVTPASSFMTRARKRQQSPGDSGRPTTSRGAAARKE